MVVQKYGDEKAIREKITELFTYRKLSELLTISQLDQDVSFVKALHDLQFAIYQLDACLESKWALEKNELKAFWGEIHRAMAALGYSKKGTIKRLKEIYRYEKIERDCRKDKWPTRISFNRFYRTKSCDVRLIRRLIYEAAPALVTTWKKKSWVYYDLITEINDDLADVREDLSTYNGNRFLISLLRKGWPTTIDEYEKQIRTYAEKADAYFEHHPLQERDAHLHAWTIQRANETGNLLEVFSTTFDANLLAGAYLMSHMR